jgi:hypothetical protein
MTIVQLFSVVSLLSFISIADCCDNLAMSWRSLPFWDRIFLIIFLTLCAVCGLMCGWQLVAGGTQ